MGAGIRYASSERKHGRMVSAVFHRQGVPIKSLSKAWRVCVRSGWCAGEDRDH